MDPRLLRLAYVFEFLLSLLVFFTLWSQIGGQSHLDLIPWYWKLALSFGVAFGCVRATVAAVEGPEARNMRSARWLLIVLVLLAVAGLLSYYYHLNEPQEDEDQGVTANNEGALNPLTGRQLRPFAFGPGYRAYGVVVARWSAVSTAGHRPATIRPPEMFRLRLRTAVPLAGF